MGLWGFDGCRRSGAVQGTGLMGARDDLFGGAIAAGAAQGAVTRAQAGRCRCDWRSGASDRSDEGVVGLSPVAPACGGLAL